MVCQEVPTRKDLDGLLEMSMYVAKGRCYNHPSRGSHSRSMTPEDAMGHSSSLVILQPEISLWQRTGGATRSRPHLLCHILLWFLASYRISWGLSLSVELGNNNTWPTYIRGLLWESNEVTGETSVCNQMLSKQKILSFSRLLFLSNTWYNIWLLLVHTRK